MKTVRNYVKNVAKSVTFMAADITKDMMPAVDDLSKTSKEFFTANYGALKNLSGSDRKGVSAIKNSKVYQALDYGAKNLVQDLKTGKFYNKEREERDMMKWSGMDMDWDDLSEFGVEDDWESNLDSGPSITDGDRRIVGAIESTNAANASSTANAVLKASSMEMENERISTSLLYQQNERLFKGLHTDLSGVDNTLRSIHSLLNASLQSLDKNSSEFYTSELRLSEERNAILKEMLEMQREQYKAAKEEREKIANTRRPSSSGTRWKDISTGNGGIDIGKYFETVKKNVSNELSMFNIGGMMGKDSNMLAMMMTSPIKSMTEMMVKGIIPATVKSAMNEFNESISGIFGTLFGRLANAANRSEYGEGSILGGLARFLGINTKVNSKIDTSHYEKGPVPWDGIARKALTDVIPTYLRQIAAGVTGQPEQTYDYNSGKWVKMHEVEKMHRDVHTNAVERGTRDLRTPMESAKNQIAFQNQSQQNDFDVCWNEFWQAIYDNNGQFYPERSMQQNFHNSYKYTNLAAHPEYYNIFCIIWKNSSEATFVDKKGRPRKVNLTSAKMKAGGNILDAKDWEESQYREMESTGGAVNQYYAVGGASGINRHGKFNNTTGKFDYSGALTSAKDKYGNSVFDYLYNINKELSWQREAWASGGSGRGRKSSRSSMPDFNKINVTNPDLIKEQNNRAANAERDKQRIMREIQSMYDRGEKINPGTFSTENQETVAVAIQEFIHTHAADDYIRELNGWIDKNAISRGVNKATGNEYMTEEEYARMQQQAAEAAQNIVVNENEEGQTKRPGFFKRVGQRLQNGGKLTSAVFGATSEAVTNALYAANTAIYNTFFKDKVKDKDGKEYKSFLEMLSGKFSEVTDKMKEAIDKNLIQPFKDKLKDFFGTEGKAGKRYIDAMKGAGKKAWNTFKQANKDVYGPAIKKVKNVMKGSKGQTTTEEQPDVEPITPEEATAEGVEEHAYGTFMGNTMLSKGEMVISPSGTSRISATGLYRVNQPSVIANSSQAYDIGKASGMTGISGRGNVSADLNRENSMARRLGVALNAEGTMTKDDIEDMGKTLASQAKTYAPEMAAGGTIGAVLSLLTGAMGGPLIGAAVGAGVSLLTKSDKFKDIVFGKQDENGERQGGLVPKAVNDTIKKYAPDAMKFGLAGIIPGLLTPFGPLGGMAIGAGIGILKNSETFKNKFFGEDSGLKISDKQKENIKKMLPGAGRGALVGAGVSILFGGPFGLLGNAALGAGIGMLTTTDQFKEAIFGKEVNGVKTGGILDELKDSFKPITDTFKEFGKRMMKLLNDNIVKPIKDFITPAIHALPNALRSITGMFSNGSNATGFGRSLGGAIGDIVKGPITKGIKMALKPVNWAANIATTPFRMLGNVGNRMRRRQITHGNADYMTAAERTQFMAGQEHLEDLPGYENFLMQIGAEGENGVSVEDAQTLLNEMTAVTTSNADTAKAAQNSWRTVERALDHYKNENGQSLDPKSKKAIRKALQEGDITTAQNLLRNTRIRGAGRTLTAEEYKGLTEGEGGLNELMRQFSHDYTRVRTVESMRNADQSELAADINKRMQELGFTDFDVNNNNNINRYMRLIETEIKDREKGGVGIDLDVDNNQAVHSIVDDLKTILERGVAIYEGTDEEVRKKEAEQDAKQKAKDDENIERLAKETAAATKEGLSDEAIDMRTGYKYGRPQKMAERFGRTRMGRALGFANKDKAIYRRENKDVAIASKKGYSNDIINAIGKSTGTAKYFSKAIKLGFDFEEDAAKVMVRSETDAKTVNSFLDKNVAKIFKGRKITVDDVQFCLKNSAYCNEFKNKCATIVKYRGDTSDIVSFKSIFDDQTIDAGYFAKLITNARKIDQAGVGNVIVKKIGQGFNAIRQFGARRANPAIEYRKEGYNIGLDAEDYMYYDLYVIDAGRLSRFFNKDTAAIWAKEGAPEIKKVDLTYLMSLDRKNLKEYQRRVGIIAKNGLDYHDYPRFRDVLAADAETIAELDKKIIRKRNTIGKLFKFIGHKIANAFRRTIGFGLKNQLIKEGIVLSEDAKDFLDSEDRTFADNRKMWKAFTKHTFAVYRGCTVKAEDFEAILNASTEEIKRFDKRVKILHKARKSGNDYRIKTVMESKDDGMFEKIQDEGRRRTVRGRIANAFRRVGAKIRNRVLRVTNPRAAYKAAGFAFDEDAEEYLTTLINNNPENIDILNKWLTTDVGRFYKTKNVTKKDLQYAVDNPKLAKEFNKICRILFNGGKYADDYNGFESIINISQDELDEIDRKKRRHTLVGRAIAGIRHRMGADNRNRVKRKRPRRILNRWRNRILDQFGGTAGANAGQQAPPVENVNPEDVEGEPVYSHGIGTMLINGAMSIGQAAVNGVKKVGKAAKNGIENFMNRSSSSKGSTRRGGGPAGLNGNNSNSAATRSAGLGFIDFGKGRIGRAREDSSGSIVPDTSDSKTALYVRQVEDEENSNAELRKATLAAANSTVDANDTSDVDGGKGKKKMSWWKLLIFGGILWKSGILGKLYEGFIKPLWTNAIKPWITDKAIPWITDTFIPAVGNLLSEILPSIITGAIKACRNIFTTTLNTVTGNETNVGASTTVDVSQFEDKNGYSDYYNEKGINIKYSDLVNGNFEEIYNSQGAQGEVEYDDDGNITGITFEDQSKNGSSYVKRALNATAHSFARGDVSIVAQAVNKGSNWLLTHKTGVIGKLAGGVGKAASGTEYVGTAARSTVKAVKAKFQRGTAETVVKDVGENVNYSGKIFAKVSEILDRLISDKHPRIQKAFSKMAENFGGGDEAGFLERFIQKVKDIFHQGSNEITPTSLKSAGEQAEQTAKSVAKTALIVVFLVTDFLLGMDRAESILGVSEVGPGEMVVCGILNAVINQVPILNIIPGAKWIIRKIFEFLDKFRPNQEKTIAERQAEAEAEAEAYNEEHGTTYTTDEYLAKTKSWSGRIVTAVGSKIKQGFKGVKNFFKTGHFKEAEAVTNYGEDEEGESSEKGFKRLGNKIKDMINGASKGDAKAMDDAAEDEDESNSAVLSVVKTLMTPMSGISVALGAVSESQSAITNAIGSDNTSEVIEQAKNGEISIFSKEYWNLSGEGADKGNIGKAFCKVKGFMLRLMNAPVILIQSIFNKIGNAISNIGNWIKDKFSWITDFLSHPFKFIWNKIRGKSNEEAGTDDEEIEDDIDETMDEIAESDSEGYTDSNGVTATGKYGYGRRHRFGRGWTKQIDPRYANLPFNIHGDSEKQTIGDSACGPAAAVNAVKAAYGRGNNLMDASNMALTGGYKEVDGGTYPEFFTDYFAQNGLGSSISYNRSEIAQNIRNGNPTVLMGRDENGTSSSTPYGKVSHYVTATGTDSNGRVIIQDPESRYDNQLYNMDDLMRKTTLGASALGKYRHFGRGIRKVTHSGRGRHGKGKYGRGSGGTIFVGDYRAYYLQQDADPDGAYTWFYDLANAKYKWFKNTACSKIKSASSSHKAVVIMLGLRDLFYGAPDNYSSYATKIKRKMSNWNGCKVFYVSVNPTPDNCSVSNSDIEKWNSNIKDALPTDVTYIDTYNYLIDNGYTFDTKKAIKNTGYGDVTDIFYDEETDAMIMDMILEEVAEVAGDSAVDNDTGIFDWLYDILMNSTVGQLFSSFTGASSSSTSSDDEEEEESDEEYEDEYDGEDVDDSSSEPEDSEGTATGMFHHVVGKKYGRGIKINRSRYAGRGKHGRGKYGRGNASNVWYSLRHEGFSEPGAAGVLGNMHVESGVEPKKVQRGTKLTNLGYDDNTYTSAVDNGTYSNFVNDSLGYGLVQWTYWSLKQELQDYAKQSNSSIGSLATQIGLVLKQLKNNYSELYNSLKTATSVATATTDFMTKFERPADQSTDAKNKRIGFAQQYYDQLKGTDGTAINVSVDENGNYSSGNLISDSASADNIVSGIADALMEILNNSKAGQLLGLSSSSDATASSGSSITMSDSDAANMVNIAMAEEGTKETPENYVKYNDWYYGGTNVGGGDKPWCAAFVSWVADQAGIDSSIIKKTASTKDEYSFVIQNGGKSISNADAKAGDLIYFSDSGKADNIHHTGIVTGNDGSTISTIEGNSSDQVKARSYNVSSNNLLIARPAYANQGSSGSEINLMNDSLATDNTIGTTLGGNGYKPVSRFGTFKRSLYGTGQKRRLYDKDNQYVMVETSDEDIAIGEEVKNKASTPVHYGARGTMGRGKYGRAAIANDDINYTNLMKAVLEVLTTIADNTDRLNTITNLITQYLDMNPSDVEVSNATKASSLKEKLNSIFSSQASSNATNKLSNIADDVGDSSLVAIINAMNAVAAE